MKYYQAKCKCPKTWEIEFHAPEGINIWNRGTADGTESGWVSNTNINTGKHLVCLRQLKASQNGPTSAFPGSGWIMSIMSVESKNDSYPECYYSKQLEKMNVDDVENVAMKEYKQWCEAQRKK